MLNSSKTEIWMFVVESPSVALLLSHTYYIYINRVTVRFLNAITRVEIKISEL